MNSFSKQIFFLAFFVFFKLFLLCWVTTALPDNHSNFWEHLNSLFRSKEKKMSKRERPLCCRKWENWKSSLRILFVLLNMEIAFLWKKPPLLQPVSDFRFWALSRRCVCEFLLVYNQAVILWNWMNWTAIRLSLRSSHHANISNHEAKSNLLNFSAVLR